MVTCQGDSGMLFHSVSDVLLFYVLINLYVSGSRFADFAFPRKHSDLKVEIFLFPHSEK